MAVYQKFLFDNFVIRCEDESCMAAPVQIDSENTEDAEITDVEFQELTRTPENAAAFPPASYSQEELDAALTRAEQKGYENGFKTATGDQEQTEAEILQSIDSKLMALLADVKNYKTQLEADSLQFAAGVIHKILPGLEKERASAEVERFMTESFPSFRKEAALSFSFNPEVAAKVTGLISKLADKNDFEGKIAVHKDATLGVSDCRIEWEDGGVERRTDNLLAKVDNLLDDNPTNQQERDNG